MKGLGQYALGWLWTAIASGLMVLGTGRDGQAATYRDVVITPEQDVNATTMHGYMEHRFRVVNRSTKEGVSVRLHFGGAGEGAVIGTMDRTVEVGPGSTILMTMGQPALELGRSNSLDVYLNGIRQDESLPVAHGHGMGGFGGRYGRYASTYAGSGVSGDKCVLVSKEVTGNQRQVLENRYSGTIVFVRADLPVGSWSANWLGYSRFDGVVITAEELKSMPSGAQEALIRSIEEGGTLLVLGEWDIPQPWKNWSTPSGRGAFMGFGRCILTSGDGLSPYLIAEFGESVDRTRAPWRGSLNVAEANRLFRVAEDVGIPIRGLFLVVLVFGVVIGPVNIWVLSRMKRRIWMLWTVPVLSLMAATAVFGYALLAEGWTADRRAQVLTVLDETSHRATSIGWTAFYCPLTPRDGLHFSYDTELTPQLGESGEDVRPCGLDWTRDQHLASGWVTARVPAHFMVRKSELRRERLSVQFTEGGKPVVVNGLGAELKQLWLADRGGKFWYGTNIAPGARATLEPAPAIPPTLTRRTGSGSTTGNSPAGTDVLSKMYPSTWLAEQARMMETPQRWLRPGTYIAVMEETPFLEAGLERARARQMKNVVYGIMPEGAAEGVGHAD